jgi:hypothetical protein
MLRIVVVAVALAVTAAPCLAADDTALPPQQPQATTPAASPPVVPEPAPEAVAVAEQIIEVTGAKAHSLAMVDAMIPTAIDAIKKRAPDVPDEALTRFRAAFRQEVEKSLPEMMHAEARLYAIHFSAAELNELLAFYRTAVGQKMLVEQPKIFTEILPLAQVWGRTVGARAAEAAIESLRQEGVKI